MCRFIVWEMDAKELAIVRTVDSKLAKKDPAVANLVWQNFSGRSEGGRTDGEPCTVGFRRPNGAGLQVF